MIIEVEGKKPCIADDVFIAPNATLIGDVAIGPHVGIWFGAVLRGDLNPVRVGEYTNIQDLCIVHTPPHLSAEIGRYVTVGHRALIHGCKIGNNCLIGMSATVMNGAVIGDDSIVGAGSLVTEGKEFPARSLIIGSPARLMRELTPDEIEKIRESAMNYYCFSKKYGPEI